MGGAAVTSILARGNMGLPEAETAASVVKSPIANRENKRDRLSVMSLAQASVPSAAERTQGSQATQTATDALRQAYASSSGADLEAAKAVEALSRVAPQPSSEPRVASTQSATTQTVTLQSVTPQADT